MRARSFPLPTQAATQARLQMAREERSAGLAPGALQDGTTSPPRSVARSACAMSSTSAGAACGDLRHSEARSGPRMVALASLAELTVPTVQAPPHGERAHGEHQLAESGRREPRRGELGVGEPGQSEGGHG